MQPITRVHNIFRIRTIVNSIADMNKRGKMPGDDEVGMVLAKTGLSKLRKFKIKDRIMRRARDHLLTASYMGLLSRIGRPFGYTATIAGRMLSSYKATEECPKDETEGAIFTDRIMRLKLTNPYDIQSGGQYADLRSRPCLYTLHVLKMKPWLHEHQLAVINGAKKCDPLMTDTSAIKILNSVSGYCGLEAEKLTQFYEEFAIGSEARKNMTRNIRPLLDWCESLGLVQFKTLEELGRWYSLTDVGGRVLDLYERKLPIWFSDLGSFPAVKAAILIFYQYAGLFGLNINRRFLDLNLRTGLVESKVSDLVMAMQKDLGIRFAEDYSKLELPIDFTWDYDVPPEQKDEVLNFLSLFVKPFRLNARDVVERLEKEYVEQLKLMLEGERVKIRTTVTSEFSKSTALSDPVLQRVQDLIPSVGIMNQFRSDFEKEVALLLRLLKLNAVKYQGQLADRCVRAYIMRFFENNPDILVINGIESLVECKSIGEWGTCLSGEKSVPKEVIVYQQYMPEIKSDSVVIIYEGTLDTESRKFIIGILDDAKDILLVTKNFLLNCVYKPALRERLLSVMKNPRKYPASSRIFE